MSIIIYLFNLGRVHWEFLVAHIWVATNKKGSNIIHPLEKSGEEAGNEMALRWLEMTFGDKIQKLNEGLLSERGQIFRGKVNFSACTLLLLTYCTGLCGAPCGWLPDLMENWLNNWLSYISW